MNETPFFVTRMGRRFYERDVPALVEQLTRMNDLLERLVAQAEKKDGQADGDA